MKYEFDPQSHLDYVENWAQWLPAGDRIVLSTWSSDAPEKLILESGAFTDETTTVWIRRGATAPVVGEAYRVTNHIFTEDGREEDRTFVLAVKEH